MGLICPRGSLFGSGAVLVMGVVDSGHCGPLRGVLIVGNTCGLRLFGGSGVGSDGGADDKRGGWGV